MPRAIFKIKLAFPATVCHCTCQLLAVLANASSFEIPAALLLLLLQFVTFGPLRLVPLVPLIALLVEVVKAVVDSAHRA